MVHASSRKASVVPDSEFDRPAGAFASACATSARQLACRAARAEKTRGYATHGTADPGPGQDRACLSAGTAVAGHAAGDLDDRYHRAAGALPRHGHVADNFVGAVSRVDERRVDCRKRQWQFRDGNFGRRLCRSAGARRRQITVCDQQRPPRSCSAFSFGWASSHSSLHGKPACQ